MKRGQSVIFIAADGKEHEALVFAMKQRSSYLDVNKREQVLFTPVNEGGAECMASGVYIDLAAPERDAIKSFHDVPHFTDESKQEPNPALPSYQLNCWKEKGEVHGAIPADHPNFDHPFHREFEVDKDGNFRLDEKGNKIPVLKSRPGYASDVAAHQAKPETQEAMAEAEESSTHDEDSKEFRNAVEFLKRRGYSDEESLVAARRASAEQVQVMSDVVEQSEPKPEPDVATQLEQESQNQADAGEDNQQSAE